MAFVELIGGKAIFWKIGFTCYKEYLFSFKKMLLTILFKITYPVSSVGKYVDDIEMKDGLNWFSRLGSRTLKLAPCCPLCVTG